MAGVTNEACLTRFLLSQLDSKWKTLIMFHLLSGEQRPGERERLIADGTRQELTRQLKELKADGLVEQQVFVEMPPWVKHHLSAFGQGLEPIMDQLYDLGRYYMQPVSSRADFVDTNCRKLQAVAG